MSESQKTKKDLILQAPQQIPRAKLDRGMINCGAGCWPNAAAAKTGTDYIADVLKDNGYKVSLALQKKPKSNTKKSSRTCCTSRRCRMRKSA
jgi:hypothetical protein